MITAIGVALGITVHPVLLFIIVLAIIYLLYAAEVEAGSSLITAVISVGDPTNRTTTGE